MSDAPLDDGPSALFRNPIGMAAADLALMRRRKARLEMVTAAASIFSGVFFGMLFIAQSARLTSLGWGAGGALVAAGLWWLLRRRHAAEVKEPQLLTTAGTEAGPKAEEGEEDDSGWDFTGLLLAVTVVPVFVLLGVLFANIVPLMVLVGFVVQAGGASDLMVLTAVVCIVLTNVAAEFGVVIPLAKRWGISLD